MIPSSYEETKYLLALCDHVTEDIIEEILLYFEYNRPDTRLQLTNRCIHFLKRNLSVNPVAIMQIINSLKLSNYYDESHNNELLQKIIIEELMVMSESLKDDMINNKKHIANCSLSVISEWDFSDYDKATIEKIISKVYSIKSIGYGKELYLSVLGQNTQNMLTALNEYEMKNPSTMTWPLNSDIMIELCFGYKKHWLLEAIKYFTKLLEDENNPSLNLDNVAQKIWQLTLMKFMNSQNDTPLVALERLKKIFSFVDYQNSEDHLFVYFNEIYRELNLFSFCVNNSKKIHCFGWYDMMKNYSALSVISKMCDLSQLDRFKVKQALNFNTELLMKVKDSKETYEKYKHWDIMTYNAYCIITSIIDIIVLNANSNDDTKQNKSNFDEIKLMISNLQPLKYRLEVLKNIFACLFLRFEYFSKESKKGSAKLTSHSDCSYFINDCKKSKPLTDYQGFMCKSQIVIDILYLLKECLTKLHDSVEMNNDNGSQKEFESLDLDSFSSFEDVVSKSIWKWKTIVNMKIENWESVSTPSLHNSLIDLSSDDEESYRSTSHKKKNKLKKKRRSKSYNECLFALSYKKHKIIDSSYSQNDPVEPDFMSLMLCSPDTLIALALEANDFAKAYKITEVNELNDSEIWSEISFTENFTAITSNIKNCALYIDQLPSGSSMPVSSITIMSMIENFLSKHNPAYNYQISDLMQTFPQLQIYDNSNSSIITLIDLLLSTGVNHNVTLGILNVAESKCREINGNIDIDTRQNNYITFLNNITRVTYNIYQDSKSKYKNKGICSLINDDMLPIKYKDFTNCKTFKEEISKMFMKFNKSTIVSKTDCNSLSDLILKQSKLFFSSTFSNDAQISNCNLAREKSTVCYLKTFFTYIENISVLWNLDKDDAETDDSSMNLEVLNVPIHEIIGKLMLEKNIPIATIDPVCKLLGIDVIHKLVLIYCVPIKCSSVSFDRFNRFEGLILIIISNNKEYNAPKEDSENSGNCEIVKVKSRPGEEIMLFIQVHNWVVGNLIKKIYPESSDNVMRQSIETRTRYLDAYLQQKKFDTINDLFNGNRTITALQTNYDVDVLYYHFKRLLLDDRFEECLKVLDALPERLFTNFYFTLLKDHVLLKLSTENSEENWKYFMRIKNGQLLSGYLFENLKYWSYEGALKVLQFYINKFDKPAFRKEECMKWINSIPIYEKISQLIGDSTWSEVYLQSNKDPETILQALLDAQEFELSLQWSSSHEVSENIKNLIMKSLAKQVLQNSAKMTMFNLDDLLLELPTNDAITICTDALHQMRDIDAMKTVVKFLMQNSQYSTEFENTCIGLQFISEMEPNERPLFWDLVHNPLLIVEQYLMNAKFDRLTKLLNRIKPFLKINPSDDNIYYNISLVSTASTSINAIDALLRIYAAKALDLRSSRYSKVSPMTKQQDELLLQSIDSINLVGNSNAFTMPDEVPSKEKWIPNSFSNSCMVCKTTIFSIIIRRHHCRRCGRLVCYLCSRHKLQINGFYSDIKVRVCDDCYSQTISKTDGDLHDRALTQIGSNSMKSETTLMEWCLTTDPKFNEEIRKEFTYEFSPNVNLCLSIMKMHSINLDYPRFLLDRGTELSKIAGNTDDGVLELMHMRRALLLSCAVLYARPLPSVSTRMTETALAHTERQLAATDALAHLATHGCHSIMPEIDILDTHYIRRLLEAEKWELALEISTKFGMSKTGVLAAWGKACLRGGCFDQARQKFGLCFKSVPTLNTSNDQSTSGVKTSPSDKKTQWQAKRSEMSTSTSQFDLYRSKNIPALLDEIVSILETSSYTMNTQLVKKSETIKAQVENMFSLVSSAKKVKTFEPALNVMHMLSNLSKIKKGDFTDFTTNSQYVRKSKSIIRIQTNQSEKYEYTLKIEQFFYDECLYYLSNYGSPSTIINFYLKYGHLGDALQYCQDFSVDEEVFTESIFFRHLKHDQVEELLKVMYDMDNNWIMWTDYIIHVCNTLDKKGMLETLLKLQTIIGDHVRAAILCVKLYTKPTQAPHAEALNTRSHRLAQATGHFQHVTRRTSIVEKMSKTKKSLFLQMDFKARDVHMNTIAKQREVVAFLSNCESSKRLTEQTIIRINNTVTDGTEYPNESILPTLFGTYMQKLRLSVLLLISGATVSEAFTLVVRIIQDYNLDALRVFSYASRNLIDTDRIHEVIELCDLMKAHFNDDICDEFIEGSITAIVEKCDSKGQMFDEVAELLISKSDNISLKISCYVHCRILKVAYNLALEHDKKNEMKRILLKAEVLGQNVGNKTGERKLSFRSSN